MEKLKSNLGVITVRPLEVCSIEAQVIYLTNMISFEGVQGALVLFCLYGLLVSMRTLEGEAARRISIHGGRVCCLRVISENFLSPSAFAV